MDLREKKTIRSIENAFLQLRAKKPLERITVKELIELAEVGKSTFYVYYRDIYDLSDKMQKGVILEMIDSIGEEDFLYADPSQFAHALFQAFLRYGEVADVLFSGGQYYSLAFRVEQEIKELVFQKHPELRNDIGFNVRLSYGTQGGFCAFVENHELFEDEDVIKLVNEITVNISPRFPMK